MITSYRSEIIFQRSQMYENTFVNYSVNIKEFNYSFNFFFFLYPKTLDGQILLCMYHNLLYDFHLQTVRR